MLRDPTSHKGDNGKVCIIGGSHYMHGAPIMSMLAAEASGVDLLYLFLPLAHAEAAKHASLNVQVHPFIGDDVSAHDVMPILEVLASMDCAVIGPGMARDAEHIDVIARIVTGAPCPLVVDASALQPGVLQWCAGKTAVLTPHLGELERMKIEKSAMPNECRESGLTILLKGVTDVICGPDGGQQEVTGGNAGLTVGGTGDALAGLTAGLIAQCMQPTAAAISASTCIKRCGDMLLEQQGYAYRTQDVIELIPFVLKDLVQ